MAEHNKIQTITMIKNQLYTLDKDIYYTENLFKERKFEYISELIELNQTLHKDKKVLEEALSKLGE